MEFKDLPSKVQTVIVMMHSVSVLESMCEAQEMTQEQFQHVLRESFGSMGIDIDALSNLIDGLNAEEDRIMNDYFLDLGIELDQGDGSDDDAEYDDSVTPKVH